MRVLVQMLTCLLSTVVLTACSQDSEDNLFPPGGCDTTAVTYALHVEPLLQNQCYSCHSGAAAPVAGSGIVLEGHAAVASFLNSASAVFLGSLNHSPGFSPMPKGGAKLSACDLQRLQVWINSGFPDN